MNSIHTNMGALTAQKNMQVQNSKLDEAMERLSSGLRINSAADDALLDLLLPQKWKLRSEV